MADPRPTDRVGKSADESLTATSQLQPVASGPVPFFEDVSFSPWRKLSRCCSRAATGSIGDER